MIENDSNYIKISIVLIFVSIFVIVSIVRYKNKIEVLNDYNFTLGKIIKYTISGEMNSKYLTYDYEVNGVTYQRYISAKTKKYDYCEDNIELCNEIRFVVIYSKNDYSKSLIDLSVEYENHVTVDQIPYPISLDNFE